MAQLRDAGSLVPDTAPTHWMLVAADRVAEAGDVAVDQGSEAADASLPHSCRPVPQQPPAKRPLGWWSSSSPPSQAARSAWRSGTRTSSRGGGLPPEPTARIEMEGGLPDQLFDHLRGLLDSCRAGTGTVVVVGGPVASGKSELLHALCTDARAAGVRVLTATGARCERDLPLGVLGQLLHSADMPIEQVHAVLGLLGDRPPRAATGDCGSEAEPQVSMPVLDRLCRVILDLARRSPLLLAVDDAHHTDAASLRFLLFLVRRIQQVPVLVLLAKSTQGRAAHPVSLAELARQPHYQRLALRWLSREEVAGTLTERIGAQAAGLLAADAFAATGGNPMLLRALIDDQPAGGAGHELTRLAGGKAFGRAVADFLYRCEPEMLRVAGGAAVLAEFGSAAMLDRLLDLDAERVGRAVDSLEEAGLLATGRFRYEAAQAAVLAGLDAGERARLHRRAAGLLHQDAAPAAVIARHLLAGGGTGDPWTVAVLQEAAAAVLADDEYETAVKCLELAERLGADDRQRAATAAQLLAVRWRFNPSAAVRNLSPLVAALQEGQLPARSATMVARFLLWLGRGPEATEALARIAADWAGEQDRESLDEIRIGRKWLAGTFPPLVASLPPEPAPAEAPVPLTVEPRLQAVTALSSVLASGADGDVAALAVDSAAQVLRGTRLTDATFESAESALLALIYADRLNEAVASCDALLGEATGRRASCWQGRLSSLRAIIAVRQGNLAAAEQLAEAAMSALAPQGWGVGVGEPLSSLLLAATAMGKYAEAAGYVNLQVPEAMFQSRFGLHYLHARGDYYLATDRPHVALSDFLACGKLMVRWGMDRPALVPWRTEAARALLELGRRDEARDHVVEQLSRLDDSGGERTRGLSLRLLAAVSEPWQRPRLLREAIEVLQASGDRLQLAHALADLGYANHSLGEASRARTMIRRAWHVARESGAEALCQQLIPKGVRTSAADAASPLVDGQSPAPLSDAEHRVAALAALGRTNREIASRLYITVSTVEQHLTRVYRKLNVSRRSGLPTWLLSGIADSA